MTIQELIVIRILFIACAILFFWTPICVSEEIGNDPKVEKWISNIEDEKFFSARRSTNHLALRSTEINDDGFLRLSRKLESDDDDIRYYVIHIFIGHVVEAKKYGDDIAKMLLKERSPGVLLKGLQFLTKCGNNDEFTISAVKSMIGHRHKNVSLAASAYLLSYAKDKELREMAKENILYSLQSRDSGTRLAAIRALNYSNKKFDGIFDMIKSMSYSDPHKNVKHYAGQYVINHAYMKVEDPDMKTVEEKSFTPAEENPYAAVENPYSIAVIIGNKDYSDSGKSVPDVDYAVNDALAIKNYLMGMMS